LKSKKIFIRIETIIDDDQKNETLVDYAFDRKKELKIEKFQLYYVDSEKIHHHHKKENARIL
jgi:hypothetical protein